MDDRIEERLSALTAGLGELAASIIDEDQVANDFYTAQATGLIEQIAADWRAMVEALEGGLDLLYGLTQWIPNDEQEILERMHTTLARVKGNDA